MKRVLPLSAALLLIGAPKCYWPALYLTQLFIHTFAHCIQEVLFNHYTDQLLQILEC